MLYLTHLASLPVLIWLAVVDLRTHRLPDIGTLPLLGGSFVVSAVVHGVSSDSHSRAVAAAALSVLVLWLLHELPGHPLGFGDVKLGASLGLQCGWWGIGCVPVFLASAFVAGGVVALYELVTGRLSRHQPVAFGPFLVIGWSLTLLGAAGR